MKIQINIIDKGQKIRTKLGTHGAYYSKRLFQLAFKLEIEDRA